MLISATSSGVPLPIDIPVCWTLSTTSNFAQNVSNVSGSVNYPIALHSDNLPAIAVQQVKLGADLTQFNHAVMTRDNAIKLFSWSKMIGSGGSCAIYDLGNDRVLRVRHVQPFGLFPNTL